MKLLVLALLLPLWVSGQEVGSVSTSHHTPRENAVLHLSNLSETTAVVALSNDSLAGKDTADFMINCGCSGQGAEPRLFVNGKEMLARIMPELDVQGIVSLTIEKEGEYAERGAIFMETKQRFRAADYQSLADYLKKEFRGYDKRDEAKYIINGSEYPNPEILLPKQDHVVFASVLYGGNGETGEEVTTYTVNLQKPH